MVFGSRLFRKSKPKGYYSESNILQYTTAADVRTQAPRECSSISSVHTGTSFPMPPTGCHPQMRSFPPPPSQTYMFANAYNHSTPESATPYSHPPHIPSSGTTPSVSQRRSQRPTCRECSTPLSLYPVRKNDKGRQGRTYYKCNRCGEFRSWADDVGVSQKNPLCKCGDYTRLDKSKKGMLYFSCALKQCGFWADRDWRDDEEASSRDGHETQMPEMAGSAV